MMERIRKMSLKELQSLEKLIVTERETRLESDLATHCSQVIFAINDLLECCNKMKRHNLGTISIECESCDEGMDFDILGEGILDDIVSVLINYTKEDM